MGKKLVDELHNLHEDRIDKTGIIINTDNLGKRKVIEFILNKVLR